MSQLFGYICSDDSLTHAVMKCVAHDFQTIPYAERTGLGIGWIQDNRTLLRKHPSAKGGDADVAQLLPDLRSRAMVGHIRHISHSLADASDLQPFRYKKWVYTQSELDMSKAWEEHRDSLLNTLPDHIRRNIQGQSLPELFFHHFVSQLQSRGAFSTQGISPAQSAAALAAMVNEIEEFTNQHKLPVLNNFSSIVVSAKIMSAIRIGQPLYYRIFNGIEAAEEEPLFAGHRPKIISHPRFRAILVADQIANEAGEWVEIPDRHAMWVDRDWTIKSKPLQQLIVQ